MSEKDTEEFPIRINKYLAHKGIATRLGADKLIVESKVFINGKRAVLGDKVNKDDVVEVKNHKKNFIYLAYNKPKGVVTANPQGDEKDILESVQNLPELDSGKFFPVGRLDKESHGLIILTNDGRVTDRLLNPIYDHKKEYVVEVDRNFGPNLTKGLEEGVNLDGIKTKNVKVKKLGEKSFSIVLTEGKNRQIKRMTESLGFTVRDLKRIRVQNIKLGKIKQNSYVEIVGKERDEFLKSLGLS